MDIVLIADVFGLTPGLLGLSRRLEADAIVDPYDGEMMGFKNEQEAYTYFINSVGLDRYFDHVQKVIDAIKNKVTLVGFSVGATAVWRLSHHNSNGMVVGGVCFYGSQIRHYTDLRPRFELNLIFPKYELHFDVLKLQKSLSTKANVKTSRVEYLHGFMNDRSENYNCVGAEKYIDIILRIKERSIKQ